MDMRCPRPPAFNSPSRTMPRYGMNRGLTRKSRCGHAVPFLATAKVLLLHDPVVSNSADWRSTRQTAKPPIHEVLDSNPVSCRLPSRPSSFSAFRFRVNSVIFLASRVYLGSRVPIASRSDIDNIDTSVDFWAKPVGAKRGIPSVD